MLKSRYEGYTDEELIDMYRDGEEDVADYLVGKYKNMVRARAKDMFILGGDNEDLIQEGMIGLFKAVKDFDNGRDASFQTFAQLCVSRQIYTAIQAAGRQKHLPLNTCISLYKEDSSAEGILDLIEKIPAEQYSQRSPEEVLIDQETEKRLMGALEEELSDFEKQVLELKMTGIGYAEIAQILGRGEKSTDNAIQRIKLKMRGVLRREKEV